MTGLELLVASHLLLQQVSDKPDIACPVQKSARVDVRWRSNPTEFDLTRTSEQLGTGHIDSKNPYGVHVATDVGGLMTGKIEYKSNIQVSSIRYPASNVACLWIDKVTIDIVIDPLIQIASEHPQGSCEYNAILEHEQKHVAIDRAVVQSHLEDVRRAASAAVQKVGMVGPKPDDTVNNFKNKMSDYVQSAVKVQMDAIYKERTVKQTRLDNKAEYDRVSAKCKKD